MLKLQTIICSTRLGRVGPAVGRWFHEFATEHGKFEAVLIDLTDFNLPIYDEAQHLATQRSLSMRTPRPERAASPTPS